MKKIVIIITSILLLSCGTNRDIDYTPQKYKIWTITDFTYNKESLIPQKLNTGHFIFDIVNNKYYLQLTLSNAELENQKEFWTKVEKKAEIQQLLLQLEIDFIKDEDGNYTITKSDINYLFTGKNTEDLSKTLQNIVYNRDINQSRGLIPFIVEKYSPNIEERLPFPKVEVNSKFTLENIDKKLILKSKNSRFTLEFLGEHRLVK